MLNTSFYVWGGGKNPDLGENVGHATYPIYVLTMLYTM